MAYPAERVHDSIHHDLLLCESIVEIRTDSVVVESLTCVFDERTWASPLRQIELDRVRETLGHAAAKKPHHYSLDLPRAVAYHGAAWEMA